MAVATTSRKSQFENEGYIIVENVFDPAVDFVPLYAEWQTILNELADELYTAGSIPSRFDDLPFERRLIAISTASGRNLPRPFDISLPQKNVKADTPIHVGPAVFHILTKPRLLDVIEEVVGPEIVSNPTQHVRLKLPSRALNAEGRSNGLMGSVPYHQDQGVLLPEADDSNIVTCWIAITDADEGNSCLWVVPRSHRHDLIQHCPTESPRGVRGIPDMLMPVEPTKPLPMRSGSIILFNQRTVHGAPENQSTDRVRISLDLRYQAAGRPTGRPYFPGFVARSKAHPESVLRDPLEWANMWYHARDELARGGMPKFNRWSADAAVCA
jgi:hypothetical protein